MQSCLHNENSVTPSKAMSVEVQRAPGWVNTLCSWEGGAHPERAWKLCAYKFEVTSVVSDSLQFYGL